MLHEPVSPFLRIVLCDETCCLGFRLRRLEMVLQASNYPVAQFVGLLSFHIHTLKETNIR